MQQQQQQYDQAAGATSPVRRRASGARRTSLRFKTPASVLLDNDDEVKNQDDPRLESDRGRGTRSLLSVRRDQIWQNAKEELSPDSRELFDDIEEAQLEHSSGTRGGAAAASGSASGSEPRHSGGGRAHFQRHVPFHLSTPAGFETPAVAPIDLTGSAHTESAQHSDPRQQLTWGTTTDRESADEASQPRPRRNAHRSPVELLWATQDRQRQEPRAQATSAARPASLRLSFSGAMSPATQGGERGAVDEDGDVDLDLADNFEEGRLTPGAHVDLTQDDRDESSAEAKTEQELLDESERLARQLMAEEEDQYLERLHQAQLETMQGMRHAGARSSSGASGASASRRNSSQGGSSTSEVGAANDTSNGEDESVALALRLMAEEEAEAERIRLAVQEATEDADFDPDEMSYDELVELGERIGNVKQERWRIDGRGIVEALPVVVFQTAEKDAGALQGVDTTKCLVCQYPYEDGEELKIMPCKHAFHKECIDPWLVDHDTCVACKQSLRDTAAP